MPVPRLGVITSQETAVMRGVQPQHLHPNGDRYLLQPLHVALITDSGMRIEMDETESGWFCGRVVAVGDGHRLDVPDTVLALSNATFASHKRVEASVAMKFSAGDIVAVSRLAGTVFMLAGKEYRIVSQVDVLCKIDDAGLEFVG